MNPILRLLPALSLLAPVVAQRNVIVDAANGPGTDHTTLAAAFADLRNHDVVTVRAGTYSGTAVTTGHSFVLLGEGSPLVQPGTLPRATVELTLNGTQYQRVAIKGMRFHSVASGQWGLTLRTPYNFWPAPTVNLEDCAVLSMSPLADRLGLLCQSVGVTVQRCSLSTTQVRDSFASFVDCTIRGEDQSYWQSMSQHAQTALDVQRSEVRIANSTLTAGNSNGIDGTPASCVGFSDATFTNASRVFLSGQCVLTADQHPNVLRPPPAVFVNYDWFYPLWPTVEREAAVVLVPSPPSGATFGASIQETTRPIPHLRASAAPLGGLLTCTVHGSPGEIAALLLAATTFPRRLLGYPVLLDQSVALLVGFAVIPAGLEAGLPLTIPADTALRGVVLQASAATVSPALQVELTNPVSAAIH